MGLGVTGAANAIEALGPEYAYGSDAFIHQLTLCLNFIRNEVYRASANLAGEKGSFPLYERDAYLRADTPQQLSEDVHELIREKGIRNSHLLSIAPTGTISLCADNISSGIEPVFSYFQRRILMEEDGPKEYQLEDYGHRRLSVKGRTTEECTINDHLRVLMCASHRVDSAVSKTCNVPNNIEWEEFKSIYERAWEAGCKGCTTYRKGGMREAILTDADEAASANEPDLEGASCEIDPVTGVRSCE
jgi:ribonucleoside-diphosphate reductase alpha chain